MSDPLFEPTLQEKASPGAGEARRVGGPAPWNLGSQFWVAFFGGPPAIGAVAWINAGRLGLSSGVRAMIVGLSVIAWGGWAEAVAAQRMGMLDRSWGRLVFRGIAVILYLVLAGMQRKADRQWRMFGGGGEYASLWKAGTIAVLAGFALQLLTVALVHALVPAQ